ncbi:MAG: undecaprenyl-diphosphate phosphatase, partial [Rickettsiales bacterium]|nr:undecaprenyl-diphosphate phosphatase [Rickettsiales bacterium]
MTRQFQFVKLLILLFINAIAEFFPISSTAHSIILSKFLKIDANLNAFLAISQLATVASLVYYFREMIVKIAKEFFTSKSIRIFCYNIFLATLPSLVFGILFHRIIRKYFHTNMIIALFLATGGMLMILIEKYKKPGKNFSNDSTTALMEILPRDMYKIGLLQAVSLLPGVSRSACTICTALFLGIPRTL